MDTLVALGTLVAYLYSLVALSAAPVYFWKVLDLSLRSLGAVFEEKM